VKVLERERWRVGGVIEREREREKEEERKSERELDIWMDR